jgi:hypothetical protein
MSSTAKEFDLRWYACLQKRWSSGRLLSDESFGDARTRGVVELRAAGRQWRLTLAIITSSRPGVRGEYQNTGVGRYAATARPSASNARCGP